MRGRVCSLGFRVFLGILVLVVGFSFFGCVPKEVGLNKTQELTKEELERKRQEELEKKRLPEVKIEFTGFSKVLKGHKGWICSIAFSPNGRLLASTRNWVFALPLFTILLNYHQKVEKGSINLWDVKTGRLIRTLNHGGYVYSVAFSPDGRYLASGSWDKTIKLWEIPSGRLIKTLKGHSGSVRSVAFSPDGRYLASGSGDKTIRLWRWKEEFAKTEIKVKKKREAS